MFQTFSWANDILYDDSGSLFPSTLSSFFDGKFEGDERGTRFGYVLNGVMKIRCRSGEFHVTAGMYFSIPGNGRIEGRGRGIMIARHDHNGFFQIGGPIENTG